MTVLLQTISTPFMVSVNGQQYRENSLAMLWSTLASVSVCYLKFIRMFERAEHRLVNVGVSNVCGIDND